MTSHPAQLRTRRNTYAALGSCSPSRLGSLSRSGQNSGTASQGALTSVVYSRFFFFSSRRRHTRLQGDWSSDVCSSDLGQLVGDRVTGTVGAVALGVPALDDVDAGVEPVEVLAVEEMMVGQEHEAVQDRKSVV